MDLNNNAAAPPAVNVIFVRDQLFYLKSPLISALFEPLSLTQRVVMKDVYTAARREANFPGDAERGYWTHLHSRFRYLCWNASTRGKLLTYFTQKPQFRQFLDQNRDLSRDDPRHPFRLMKNMIQTAFFHICTNSPLESIKVEDLPHLPRNNLPAHNGGISWLTDSIYGAGTLRRLAIQVKDIDRQWFFSIDTNFPRYERERMLRESDPLLYILQFHADVFAKIKEKLEKFSLNFKFNDRPYGLEPDCITRVTHHFARNALQSVYEYPWIDDVTDDPSGEAWREKFPPFRVLNEYYLMIKEMGELLDSSTMIQNWHTWSYYFVPPPQLRTLHLHWLGLLTPFNTDEMLSDFFIEKLSKYTMLTRFEVMVSFKVASYDEDEVRSKFRAAITQMKDQLVQLLTDGHELQWPFRILVLKFIDNTTHNEIMGTTDDDDENVPDEEDFFGLSKQNVHLSETTMLCEVLTGQFATNLRVLHIHIYSGMDPLSISAPQIQTISCDLSELLHNIESFYPLFSKFKHPETVRVLRLENFATREYLGLFSREQIQARRLKYTEMFEYFFTLFKAVERVELISEKQSPNITDEETFDRVEENEFYCGYWQTFLECIRKQCCKQSANTRLRELSLLDAQPKPLQLLIELIQIFIQLATENLNKNFLLHIEWCELLLIKDRSTSKMTSEQLIAHYFGSYKAVLAQACKNAPNLRLVVPPAEMMS